MHYARWSLNSWKDLEEITQAIDEIQRDSFQVTSRSRTDSRSSNGDPRMNEKFELHSKFQLEGVFWDAANPDDKFAGTLSCDGKRLELNTRAELVTPTPGYSTSIRLAYSTTQGNVAFAGAASE